LKIGFRQRGNEWKSADCGKSNAEIREKAMADSHFGQGGYWGDGLDIHIGRIGGKKCEKMVWLTYWGEGKMA
jgi:hypothetical protein